MTQQSKKLEHTEASYTVARDGKVGSELRSISPPDNGNSHLPVRKLRYTSATQLTPYHQTNNFFHSKCHRSAAPLWHNFFRLGATINLDGSTSRHETVERKSLLMANESSRNLLVSYPTPWNASDRLRRRQKSTCRYSQKKKNTFMPVNFPSRLPTRYSTYFEIKALLEFSLWHRWARWAGVRGSGSRQENCYYDYLSLLPSLLALAFNIIHMGLFRMSKRLSTCTSLASFEGLSARLRHSKLDRFTTTLPVTFFIDANFLLS